MEKINLNLGDRSAVIHLMGAELSSYKIGDWEYIWQADPAIWARHAPILFPIVGRLKDNRYTYQGKTYSLGQHGFARDSMFELVSSTETSAVFVLRADAESLRNFPFLFELLVRYEMLAEGLEVSYEVKNVATEADLLFSIGAHPGFKCPLNPESELLSDYILDFGNEDLIELGLYPLEDGYISMSKRSMALSKGMMPLKDQLFLDDALIMDVLPPAKVSVRHRETGRGFGMEFADFQWIGIWSKEPDAGFVCLEPWSGIADTVDHQGDFSQKLGIQRLRPKASYVVNYRMYFW
ncbi:aldose 1-epimerase family protein [Lunatimonas sp.]|uniref:aldose 1-epimerase family protein n=1 Tax=Lunatimonas sp. TaxID=2060141 RepID=UPI00344CF51E